MLDLETTAATPRDELLRMLRARLDRVVPAGRLVAEGILGEDARIDFVLTEPSGRVALVFVGAEGEDLALVGRALAQRGWVSERLTDWHQLSPGLGIRPEAGVVVCLLAPSFSEEARAAARSLGEHAPRLIRFHGVRDTAGVDVLIEAPIAPGPSGRASAVPESGFPNPLEPDPRARFAGSNTAATPAAAAQDPAGSQRAASNREPARFRTGLTDRDLGLTREERGEFE